MFICSTGVFLLLFDKHKCDVMVIIFCTTAIFTVKTHILKLSKSYSRLGKTWGHTTHYISLVSSNMKTANQTDECNKHSSDAQFTLFSDAAVEAGFNVEHIYNLRCVLNVHSGKELEEMKVCSMLMCNGILHWHTALQSYKFIHPF